MPEADFFESIRERLGQNPANWGWIAIVVGVFALAAAVFNWRWVFRGGSYNTEKTEGISNVFDRGFARLFYGFLGLAAIAVGIAPVFGRTSAVRFPQYGTTRPSPPTLGSRSSTRSGIPTRSFEKFVPLQSANVIYWSS